jgi:hypothetical protein
MTTPVKLERCPVTDALVDAALHARVPGGAEVWNFLPQKDAFNPHETARAVIRAALEMAFAMHQASRIAEGIVSEEVVEDEEAASRRRQEAFNNYSHLAERALRSWLGGKLTSRDLHVWSQGYDAALHTLSVGGGRD